MNYCFFVAAMSFIYFMIRDILKISLLKKSIAEVVLSVVCIGFWVYFLMTSGINFDFLSVLIIASVTRIIYSMCSEKLIHNLSHYKMYRKIERVQKFVEKNILQLQRELVELEILIKIAELDKKEDIIEKLNTKRMDATNLLKKFEEIRKENIEQKEKLNIMLCLK